MWMDNWVLNTPVQYWPKAKSQINSEHSFSVLYRFFETSNRVIVLAGSNKADIEVKKENAENQNIPILQRKGGGGTVVLGPGCLVLTFAFFAKDPFNNSHYFHLLNSLWMEALADAGVKDLRERGISDVCIGDKKIIGTSIFRRKHLLVYQGSLLVDLDLEFMATLLRHPSREPDYRQGRNHLEFVSTLNRLGHSFITSQLASHCQSFFQKNVYEKLKNDVMLEVPSAFEL